MSAESALNVESLQKTVRLAARFPPDHGIQANRVNAAEDTLLDVRIVSAEAADQRLDFLTLGFPDAVSGGGDAFGKPACALDELQTIIPFPGENIVFMDAIKRPYQLHARKILAVKLRRHRLQLCAVKQAHDDGLNDIVEMVP